MKSGIYKIESPSGKVYIGQRWVDLGWYKELIDDGFIFAPYCGRFKTEICECGKCRNKKPNRDELIKIIKWETSQTT